MTLTLAWWNTGLSPTKARNRASEDEIRAAGSVIRQLLIDTKVDFLALGEVSSEDIEALQTLLADNLRDFVAIPTNEKAGRSHFDTGLFHRRSIAVSIGEVLIRRKLSRVTRVAQRFDIVDSVGSELLVYVSHWPSRGTIGSSDPERLMLGNVLRESINETLERSPTAALVLLGDYNDEPFDPVMDNALLSSRDRALVLRNSHLLYNPFWRHMSCFGDEHEQGRVGDRGTYFHSTGLTTRWRTFDHMMFSAALLSGKGSWILDEHATRVANIPDLAELLEERSSVFDHMPIIGRLQRSTQNG